MNHFDDVWLTHYQQFFILFFLQLFINIIGLQLQFILQNSVKCENPLQAHRNMGYQLTYQFLQRDVSQGALWFIYLTGIMLPILWLNHNFTVS